MRTGHLRRELWQRLTQERFDVAIVGGGINGAVAAAALSASGLKVVLLEKGDFASSTSQESSNLVWGGIKYLESYEFGLVWDLCRSRNELMRAYPDEVQELRFFTHLERGFRKPRFLVFLGAVLYWMMGRFVTRPPRLLSRKDIEAEEAIVNTSKSQGGLEYSDCFLRDNDARFVFHFIRRALRRGAAALNYASVQALGSLTEDDGKKGWKLGVKDLREGTLHELRAKVLINAGGPYADTLNQMAQIKSRHHHIFSKGVHLIVRRLTMSDKVLTFFADDGRLFFVIPMGARSCIGTTDTRVTALPAQVEAGDRRFILDNINKRLRLEQPLTEGDIIAERCGVRPLVVRGESQNLDAEDWVNLSRKHEIEVDRAHSQLTIFGGKLTDCLNIGREQLAAVRQLGLKPQDPGVWFGEGSPAVKHHFEEEAGRLGLDTIKSVGEGDLAQRLWRNYGEDAIRILELMHREPALKELIVASAPLVLAEASYMAEEEMVEGMEDFLRRRTRLALVVRREELAQSQGLYQACKILFGERADEEWERYFKASFHRQSQPLAVHP